MSSRKHRTNRKHIAYERVGILFDQAARFYSDRPDLSDRCVEIARKIAMKERIKIPRKYRRCFCRRCYSYFVVGDNMMVRIHGGKIVVTCGKCGYIRRYPIKKEVKNESES